MLNGAETAPTMRSTTAKLVTKMIEFVCNSLVFLIAKITKMFNKTANEPMRADKAIPSCMNTFLSKSQIISGAPRQKNFDREDFKMESSDILTLMSTYDQSSDQYDSVYPPIWSQGTCSLCNHFIILLLRIVISIKKKIRDVDRRNLRRHVFVLRQRREIIFLGFQHEFFCFVLFLFENEHFPLRSLISVRKITCCKVLEWIWCEIKIKRLCWLIELFSSSDCWILYQHCRENNCIFDHMCK